MSIIKESSDLTTVPIDSQNNILKGTWQQKFIALFERDS